MAHIRTQQRAFIKAMLAGSPDAAGRVLVRRGLPLQKDFQPTFLVSFQNERSEDVSMGGAQLRTLEVRVTACVKGDSEAGEDTLDRMALWPKSGLRQTRRLAAWLKPTPINPPNTASLTG